jgi:pyruvate/2-oxoglutarate dehydrogenase complex dihydrolipoamide dehydrogenase (E3) component
VELNKKGAIVVDQYSHTNVDSIWAIGVSATVPRVHDCRDSSAGRLKMQSRLAGRKVHLVEALLVWRNCLRGCNVL